MNDNNLKIANNLQKEIKELDYFIWRAEKSWTGKIIKKDEKYIFKANGYGVLEDAYYNLDNEMKNRMLVLLRERLVELKEKFNNL